MTDEKKTETAKEAATVKKAMISQPMAGKTDEEIVATRDLAVAKLRHLPCGLLLQGLGRRPRLQDRTRRRHRIRVGGAL